MIPCPTGPFLTRLRFVPEARRLELKTLYSWVYGFKLLVLLSMSTAMVPALRTPGLGRRKSRICGRSRSRSRTR